MDLDRTADEKPCLEVVNAQLAHNHELSEERYHFYPKVRRLSVPEKEEARKMLQMHVKAGDVKAAICEATKKKVQSKDVMNIARGKPKLLRALFCFCLFYLRINLVLIYFFICLIIFEIYILDLCLLSS